MLRQFVRRCYHQKVFNGNYLDVRNPSKINVIEFLTGRQFKKQYSNPTMFTDVSPLENKGKHSISFDGSIPVHIPNDATVKIIHKDSKILVDKLYVDK